MTKLIAFDDVRWDIVDYLCDTDCSKDAVDYARSLLKDPRFWWRNVI